MRLLNSFETAEISGGDIMTYNGMSAYVYTADIPDYCVAGTVGTINVGLNEYLQNPYATDNDIRNAMSPYEELLDRAGCGPYVAPLAGRIGSAFGV